MQYSKKLYAYFLALVMGLGSVFSCPLAVGTEQTVVALTQKPPAAESSRHHSRATAEPEKQGTIAPVSEAFEAWAQTWLKEQSEEALAAAEEEAKTHLRQPLQAAPSSQGGQSHKKGQGSQTQSAPKDGTSSLYFPLEKIHSGLIPSPLELERPSYFAKVDPARRGGDPELENLLPALQTARPLRSTPLGGSLSEEEISRLVQQKRFSLADLGHITPIKNQGLEGNCWAFATMATIEGNWHKDYNESLDLSERHLAVKNGFNLPVGGNMMMANGYLGLRKGPVSEKSLPYSNDKGPYDGTYPRTIQIAHSDYSRTQPLPGLRQAFKRDHNYSSLGDFKSNPKAYEDFYKAYLDYIRPIQERNVLAIKRQLVTQGVVSTALYSKPDAVLDDIYAYTPFDSKYAEKNDHAVAIVGWDDSISKENFTAFEERYKNNCFLPSRKQLPHRDGAFICKNSWGPDKCDQGYFYISYDDLNVGSEENCSFTCVPNDPAKTTWYHGKYGTSGTAMPWRIPSVSEIYYGNYFSNPSANKGGKTELLDSVTLDFVTYDTDYKVYILTDLKDPSAISVAGKTPVVEGRIEYAGVKNIPLPTPGIQVAPGSNFAVIVYAHFDEPAVNPLAVERSVKTKAYDKNNRLSLVNFTEVTSEANQSFVSRDGKRFDDCKRLFKDPIHLQVKAHSHPTDEEPTPPTRATKPSQPTSKDTTAITTTTTTKATSTPTKTKATEDTKGTNGPSPTTNIPGPSPKPTKSGTPSSSKETADPNPGPNPDPNLPYDPVPTPEFTNKISPVMGVDSSALEGIINIQLPDSSVDLGLNEALIEAKKQAADLRAMDQQGKSPEEIQTKVDNAVAAFEKAVKEKKFAQKGVILKLVTNLPAGSLVMKNGSSTFMPTVYYAFATNKDIVQSHIMNFDDRSVTVDGRPYILLAWEEPDNGKPSPVGARLFMALKRFFGFGADPDETFFTLQGSWIPKPQTPHTAPATIASDKLQKQAQTYWQGGNKPVVPSADRAELEAAYRINLKGMSQQNQDLISESQEYGEVKDLYQKIFDGTFVTTDTIRKTIDQFDAALQTMKFANEGVILKLRTNLPAGLTVTDAQNKKITLPAYKYQFYNYLDLAEARVENFRDNTITDKNDAPWILTAWKGDDKTVPGPFGAGPQAGQLTPVQGADDQCLYSLVGEWAQDSKPREVVIDCNDLLDQIARHPNQKPTASTSSSTPTTTTTKTTKATTSTGTTGTGTTGTGTTGTGSTTSPSTPITTTTKTTKATTSTGTTGTGTTGTGSTTSPSTPITTTTKTTKPTTSTGTTGTGSTTSPSTPTTTTQEPTKPTTSTGTTGTGTTGTGSTTSISTPTTTTKETTKPTTSTGTTGTGTTGTGSTTSPSTPITTTTKTKKTTTSTSTTGTGSTASSSITNKTTGTGKTASTSSSNGTSATTSTTESTKTTPTVNPSTPTNQPDWKCTDLELYYENGYFYVRVETEPEKGHKSIAEKELQLQLWAGNMDLGSYTINTERNQIIQIEDTKVIQGLTKLVDGSDITGIISTQTQTNPPLSTQKKTTYWIDRTDLEAALDLATDPDHGLQQALEKANKTDDAKKFAEAIANLNLLKQELSEPNRYTQAKLAEQMEAFRNLLRSLSYEDLGVVLAYHANLPENIIQEPNSRIPAIQHYAFLTYDQIKKHQYLDQISRFDYQDSWRKQNGDPTTANVLNDGRDLFYLTGWSEQLTPVKAGITPSGIRLAAPFLQQILLGRPVEAKSTDDLKVVDLYAVWSKTKPQNPQEYSKNTDTRALDNQAERKTSTVPSPTPTPSDSNSTEPSTTPTPSNSNPTDPSPTPTPSNSTPTDPRIQPTASNKDGSAGGNDKGLAYDGRKDGLGGSSGSRGRKEAVLFVQRGDRTGNVLSAPANSASQGTAGLNAQNSQALADQAAAAQQKANRINADGQAPGLNQYQNQPGAPVAANNVPQTGERSTIPMILILSLSAILLILKRQRIRP